MYGMYYIIFRSVHYLSKAMANAVRTNEMEHK